MNRLSAVHRIVFAILLSACIVFGAPRAAQAAPDCSQTSPPTCVYVTVGATQMVQPKAFTFSNPNPDPTCEKVTNTSCPYPVMVPDGTQAEWHSFINSTFYNNSSGCATLASCDNNITVALTITDTSVSPNPSLTVTAVETTKSQSFSVTTGDSATLSWTVSGGTNTVTCVPSGTGFTGANAPLSGTNSFTGAQTPPPTLSGTYSLKCSDSYADTATASISVGVTYPPVSTPITVALTGTDTTTNTGVTATNGTQTLTIKSTDGASLAWSVTGGLSGKVTCTPTSFSTNSALSGSTAISPSNGTTYTLACTDTAGDSGSSSITVDVNGNCSATPGELWNGTACVQVCPNNSGQNGNGGSVGFAYLGPSSPSSPVILSPGNLYAAVNILYGEETVHGFPTDTCYTEGCLMKQSWLCSYGTPAAYYIATQGIQSPPYGYTCSSGTQTPAVCAFGNRCMWANIDGCH